MRLYRVWMVAVFGALPAILIAGSASAFTAERLKPTHAYLRPIEPAKVIIGLGFGLGPWWAPYDYYAPPAYYYPPPTQYPPPASSTVGHPGVPPGCREVQYTVMVEGQSRPARGLACQQRDGTWRMVQ